MFLYDCLACKSRAVFVVAIINANEKGVKTAKRRANFLVLQRIERISKDLWQD